MIPISEALQIIENQTSKLSIEKIELPDSVGRVLAENILSDSDLPPFDRSQMDGFAVRAKDVETVPARLKITGESVAGKGFDERIKRGEAVRIMTGARLPEGADAVQKKELAQESADGATVEILESVKPHQHFVARAEEIKSGAKIFSTGEIISEKMIAVLAAFGYAKVKVAKRPEISILSTGSEIVEINQKPKRDQIRNSNSLMLKVLAEQASAEVEILTSVKDKIFDLKFQIAQACNAEFKIQNSNYNAETKSKIHKPKSEILIITGGVSVGDYDFTKPALRELGAEIFFERVSLRPGKPTVFARLGDTLIFGLPGNPVSAAVTFYLFVRTAILKMQNAKNYDLKKGCAVVQSKIKGAKERDSYLPVAVETNEKGMLIVESLRFGGSSNFIEFARANALLFVPQGAAFEMNDVAQILFLP